jgi:hypothetical protein
MARQQQRLTALQFAKHTKLGLYGNGGGLTLQITAMLASVKMMSFDQCASRRVGNMPSMAINGPTRLTLTTYANLLFDHLPVSEVGTGLVVKCLAPVWESKTETVSHVGGRIEPMLGWATISGYCTGKNPARCKGHLENLLATITTKAAERRIIRRYRCGRALARLCLPFSALRVREGVSARAFEFAILTACRSGKVRSARWAELIRQGKFGRFQPSG